MVAAARAKCLRGGESFAPAGYGSPCRRDGCANGALCLGLTQQQMAELIGVTYQQAHKYEKGINRIAGGRLYQIAQALGVDVSYFYDGVGVQGGNFKPTPQQRLLLELARNFSALPSRRHQEAICGLVRALADLRQLPLTTP